MSISRLRSSAEIKHELGVYMGTNQSPKLLYSLTEATEDNYKKVYNYGPFEVHVHRHDNGHTDFAVFSPIGDVAASWLCEYKAVANEYVIASKLHNAGYHPYED